MADDVFQFPVYVERAVANRTADGVVETFFLLNRCEGTLDDLQSDGNGRLDVVLLPKG